MTSATEFVPAKLHGRRATSSTTVVIPMTRGVSRARVDAGGSRLRLRALHVMGHGSARISRAIGVREESIQRLVRGDTTDVSPNLRDTITDLYCPPPLKMSLWRVVAVTEGVFVIRVRCVPGGVWWTAPPWLCRYR